MALSKHLILALVAFLAATGGSARVLHQAVGIADTEGAAGVAPPIDASTSPSVTDGASPSPGGKYDGMVGPPFGPFSPDPSTTSPTPSDAIAPDCGVAYQAPKEIASCCAGKTALHQEWNDFTCVPDPSALSPGPDVTVSPPPIDTTTTVSPPPIVTPPVDIKVDTAVSTVVAPNIINDIKNLITNNNVNQNQITIQWPAQPSTGTGSPSSSSSSASASASAGGATAAVSSPGCPAPATPPPAITRYDLKATSAHSQFEFPPNAWTSKTGVPGVNATGFVGCDGKPAVRAPSDTLADCQRFATSLQFATALMWNSTGRYCIPLRSINAPLPASTGTDVTVSTWSIGYEATNATVDGNCAKTATIFSV